MDDLVKDMAALLSAPCILEDDRFNLLAFSGHVGLLDEVRQRFILERRTTREVGDWFVSQGMHNAADPFWTPAMTSLGLQSRLCIPARHSGKTHGFFWLLDPDRTIDEKLLPSATQIAELAALLIGRSRRRGTRLSILYREVLEGDRTASREAARELATAAGFSPDEPVTSVLVERGSSDGIVTSLPRGQEVLWLHDEDLVAEGIVRGQPRIWADSQPPDLLRRWGFSRSLNQDGADAIVGIGQLVGSVEQLSRSRSTAQTALRVARAGSNGHIAHWDGLRALKILDAATNLAIADALVDSRLREFLHDPRYRDLKLTAREFLDSAGNVAITADRLHIHRQTLYLRLQRVYEAVGLDLRDGGDRLYLHLALVLDPFLGSSGAREDVG